MNKKSLMTAFMMICIILSIDAGVTGTVRSAGDFMPFYLEFQNGVKSGDKDKVAGMNDFAGFSVVK